MGIPNVSDYIYQYTKEYIKKNSEYNPLVLKQALSSIESALVVISELDNTLKDETLKKDDQKYFLTYEVDIFSVDITKKGKMIARQIVIDELKKLVNDVFDEHFGFTRRACRPIANIDRDVNRQYMRYECVIDEENKIYRR